MLPSCVSCGPPYGALPPIFENKSVGRGSATQSGETSTFSIAAEAGFPDFASLKVGGKSIFSRPDANWKPSNVARRTVVAMDTNRRHVILSYSALHSVNVYFPISRSLRMKWILFATGLVHGSRGYKYCTDGRLARVHWPKESCVRWICIRNYFLKK